MCEGQMCFRDLDADRRRVLRTSSCSCSNSKKRNQNILDREASRGQPRAAAQIRHNNLLGATSLFAGTIAATAGIILTTVGSSSTTSQFNYIATDASQIFDTIQEIVSIVGALMEQLLWFSTGDALGGGAGDGVDTEDDADALLADLPAIWDSLNYDVNLVLEATHICDTDGSVRRELEQGRDLKTLEELDNLVKYRQEQLAEARAKIEGACVTFKQALAQLTIWGRAAHEAMLRMAETVREIRVQRQVVETFAVRADSWTRAQQRVMRLAGNVLEERALAEHDKTAIADALVSARQALYDERAMSTLDSFTALLKDMCRAYAYIAPDRRSIVRDQCASALSLKGDAVTSASALVDELDSVWNRLNVDYLTTLDQRSVLTTEHVLDVTSLVNLPAARAQRFAEFDFVLQPN